MALAFNVTFQVDMTNVSGFTTANVNGTFNNWCGGCAAMTDANNDNVWDITFDIPAGTYEYKFTADGWTQQESLTPGSACTVTNFGYTNRSLTVTGDVVLPVVCWGACASCTSVYPVTFKVDMANVTSAYTQVQLAGSFNGWNPPANAMTDANSDGVYETTISLAPGTYEYKFAADNWTIQENLTAGSSCTVTNFGYTNRTITVTNAGQVLDAVCWGACVACNAVLPSYNVTFKVDMSQTTGFTTPELNGTFNNWCGNCTQMSDANSDGIWEVTVSLQAGTYEYKFAHDNWAGSEQLTEGSSCTVTNGGFTNRVITVSGNTILDPVCYASCSACVVAVPGCNNSAAVNYNPAATTNDGSCLFATTLNVDMTCAGTFTNVYATGPWCGWCGAETYNVMTDANSDGIYTVVLNLAAGNVEYKYMVDNWSSQENLIDDVQAGNGSCAPVTDGANYANRQIVVGTTANDVYGRCSACPGNTYNVTFKVDLSQVTSSFTTPTVNGSFNGWSGNANPLTDANNDGIWETTINLAPGSYEYKFAADDWAIQENLVAGSSCTVTNFGYTNRSLTVGSADQVLDAVCWGACVACSQVAPNYNVTFRVNMSQTTGFTTPEVNGTFNNWCGNCTPMTDANNDGIWEVTVSLQSGVTYEYKYSYDAWAGQENLTAGSSCTVTNGAYTNRVITVTAPATLDVVCFGSCTDCGPISVPGCTNSTAVNYNASATTDDGSCLYATTFNVDMACAGSYSTVHVTGPWCGWCGAEAYNTMSDDNNDGVYTVTVNLAAGNVEYKYMVDNWSSQENLVDDMQNGGTCAPVTDYANYANRQGVIGSTFNDVYGSCSACCLNLTYYVDADGDGEGAGNAVTLCAVPTSGYSLNGNDCNDNSAAVNTSATEVCGNATDENCDGIVGICADDYAAATNVVSIGQYGTGVQTSINVNLASASNSVQSAGSGNDAWYTFTAAANAVRIALKGSTSAQDDNDLALYDYEVGATGQLIPLSAEDDVHVGSQGNATDAGNEVLCFDGLTVGNTYAICVSNNNNAPGTCVLTISNLNASTTDIGPYTSYTNNYTSTCQNFKVKYRAGAIAYTVNRWADATMQGAADFSYTIGGSVNTTICQLGKIVGANFSGQSQTKYVSVDVTYSLTDAFGNPVTVTAVAQNAASFTMSSEAALTVRATDQCPAYKNPVYNSIATNRSVCGTSRYQWEFTLQYPTVGLPSVINGNVGGTRTLPLSAVSGITTGQRYDVRIQSKHSDNVSVSDFSTSTCVRTLGAAGMPTLENNNEVVAVKDNASGIYAAYPNPFDGNNIRIALSNVEGTMDVIIVDVTGKVVHQEQVVSEGELIKDLSMNQSLPTGMYQLIFKNNGNVQSLKLMVSK